VRLWDVPPPSAWPGMLCDKLTANMNRRQWNAWVSADIHYETVCPGLPDAPDTI
jgi:hypothetical protein